MAEQQRLLSLVPVGLREAVIDSPPFRASVRHFEDQVEGLEKWLESYIKILSDWLAGMQRFEELTTTICARAAPGFLADGMIDPDYTFLAMTRFAEGVKLFWGKVFGQGKEMRDLMINPMTKFVREDIRDFRTQKRDFRAIQERYEELVSRYASQSKSKDSAAIREEAIQLYNARIAYMQASSSYSIAISTFRTSCDRVLVSAFAGFATRELRLQGELNARFLGLGKEMRKVLAWNDEMTASAKTLQDQLYVTRTKLEKEVTERIQPKRDLAIYKANTLSPQEKNGGLRFGGRLNVNIDTSDRRRNISVSLSGKPAKQGWLFHRVSTGKPVKNAWVRRWFFVKDGAFGYLNISSKSAGVEESERVGVLLCNVRLSPGEERRFCFEVMTKSNNYMLQAETESDLADWVQVFELAKNAVLADEKEQHPQAFAIMAPSNPEFAVPPIDEHDRHGSGGPTGLAPPQPTTPRASFDVAPPTGGGGSLQASRSIVQKLDKRLKDRPKGPSPAGGIASLVQASQTVIAGQHVPVQQLQISVPRPLDIFADLVGGTNMAPGTLAPPPLSTQMSTRAVQARSRAASNAAPNAPSGVMANYWGSMNWGLVSVDDVSRPIDNGADSTNQAQSSADNHFEKSQRGSPNLGVVVEAETDSRRGSFNHRRSHSRSTSSIEYPPIQYPQDYPVELKKQDAQFRTLFPASRADEFVLLVCRVMWQPVEGQQLWGRMYATNSGLHFFAHAQGMVCIQSVPFSDIIKISHHVGISADNIVIERDNMDPIDAKVYLDSANLLTRRIDVLFRNSLSDQPTDTHELLHQIRQMEEERDSDEEEESPRQYAHEEDFEIARSPKANEGMFGEEAALHGLPSQLLRRSGDSVRVVFPSEPVICNCKDHLERRFAELVFHIPAKSLFHLMFGDNTPIWKKVYRGRKVGDLEIGPWKSVNKQLIREYKYMFDITDVLSRKQKETQVTEFQTILKRDEFLYPVRYIEADRRCYVVLVKSRPWDLPRNENIELLHQYCISYESKAKCKLLVSIGVDLIKVPRIVRALVKRATNQAIEDTAKRVVAEVESQVNVLGRGSDIQRAIKMYGRIGAIIEGQVTKTGFVGDSAQPAHGRSMMSLFMEDMLGTAEGILEDVFYLPMAGIRQVLGFINAHKILLAVLVFSMIVNVFLSGRSTLGYWQYRHAEKVMRNAGVQGNIAMIRMVSLKDIDNLVSNNGLIGANATEHGLCYNKFAEYYSLNDLGDANYDNAPEFLAPTRKKASELRSRRQQLNVLRHDLLVSLRSVNTVEKGLVEGEWMTWLGDELYRCDRAAQLLAQTSDEGLETRKEDIEKLRDYCGDCNRVWRHLKEQFTALS